MSDEILQVATLPGPSIGNIENKSEDTRTVIEADWTLEITRKFTEKQGDTEADLWTDFVVKNLDATARRVLYDQELEGENWDEKEEPYQPPELVAICVPLRAKCKLKVMVTKSTEQSAVQLFTREELEKDGDE